MKALGEATDAETKLRIESKLAILDNNEALAKNTMQNYWPRAQLIS